MASSELRIPADPAYIVVAKRAASGFAYVAGFTVEAMDDLSIAIAQACEHAIRCVRDSGQETGWIRLSFKLHDRRLEVLVTSSCTRADQPDEAVRAPRPVPERARHAMAARQQVDALAREAAVADLGMRVMGLFVDDCRYRVDERTGGLRVRLTKYRVS